VYDEIAGRRRARPARRVPREACDQVSERPARPKIKATVTGPAQALLLDLPEDDRRGREFTDIYDLVGIRVLTESCATATPSSGVLHARWNPVPGRFKDFIAMPKFNMYQSCTRR
jgi:GTP pyrophosphokinase